MKSNMILSAGLLLSLAVAASAAPKATCNPVKRDSLRKDLLAQAESVQKGIRPSVAPRLAAIQKELGALRKYPGFDDGVAAAAKNYSEMTQKTYDRNKSLELLNKVVSDAYVAPGLIMSEETYVKGVESGNQIALKVVSDEMTTASPSLDASYRAKSNATALKMLALYAELQYDFMIKRAVLTSELGHTHQIVTVQKYADAAGRALPAGYVDKLTRFTAEARSCIEESHLNVGGGPG